ncbi:MAG: hypothetical protein Q8O12_01305 [Candidatus Omnitrophota bacterium]|nr:hypothetical protein [Candidatus Omnitrophota bacterium]
MRLQSFKKVIAILTILTFIATNSIYAAPDSKSIFKNKKVDYEKLSTENQDVVEKKKSVLSGEDASQAESQRKEAKRILSSHLSDLSLIHIPSEIGRITEVYQNPNAENSRLIVHIQDFHTNPEAEYNLAKILELLLNDYKMGLVCSEGAVGGLDTKQIASFPDYAAREKVGKIFVNAGELTGEEYLAITKYPDIPIWGIETEDIYFKNIIDFNKIMKFNLSSQTFISQAKKALDALKQKIYTKELIELDNREADYKAEKIESPVYINYLLDFAPVISARDRSKDIRADYPNISLFKETMEAEKKIDQLKVMNESQSLLLNLQSSLLTKSLKADSDMLMANAQLFKDQKISPFAFYSYLKDLANRHLKDDFSVRYPNLNSFTTYLTKVNSLDSTQLFLELENLNFEIKQALSKTEEQKTLVKALRNIDFLEGFFNLKVSNEELDYYLNNRDSHKVVFFESFLKPALKKYNIDTFINYSPSLIDSHLTELEEFYKVVKDRDVAMVDNSVSEIEKRGSKVSALIAGGFHTKGITKLLKEKGYSYIVVSPYSKTDIDEENYHFLLTGQRKPIEELLNQLDSKKILNKLTPALRVILSSNMKTLEDWNNGPDGAIKLSRLIGVGLESLQIQSLLVRGAIALILCEIEQGRMPVTNWADCPINMEIWTLPGIEGQPRKGFASYYIKGLPEKHLEINDRGYKPITVDKFPKGLELFGKISAMPEEAKNVPLTTREIAMSAPQAKRFEKTTEMLNLEPKRIKTITNPSALADKSALGSGAGVKVEFLFSHLNTAALSTLTNMVSADDSVIAFVAGKVLSAGGEERTRYKTVFNAWRGNLGRTDRDAYPIRLISSAIEHPEAWKDFIDSVEGNSENGAQVVKRTKEVFDEAAKGTPGYATTAIDGYKLKEVPDSDKIDLTTIDRRTLKVTMPSHRFAPKDKKPTYAALLGGAGRRYIDSLVREPETVRKMKQVLGPALAGFVSDFKSSLPVGDTGMTNLELQLGRNDNIGPIVVAMAAHNNHNEAVGFIKAVTDKLSSRGLGSSPRVLSFIQPIVPRRVPAGRDFNNFFNRDKESAKGIKDPKTVEEYANEHQGEIALDNEGRPIFGPENHWDFTKYFMQNGIFLDLLEASMDEDGQVRDVILREANQDDLGVTLGENRPFEVAVNKLLDEMQGKDGLYEFLDSIEEMGDEEWTRYRQTPEFRARLLKVKGAIIEGGLSIGYGTGGGIFNYEGSTLVAEKANIVGHFPPTTIQNSNSITKSLLADALMCGLRPKDITAMIETRKANGGNLSGEQKARLVEGVQEAERLYVPIRQQIKISNGIPIQGTERDIHGPLGRAYGLLELVGHSVLTYRSMMSEADKELLSGLIDFEEHQRLETDITRDLVFVPEKHLDQWREGKRSALSIMKFLGYRVEPPVRDPGDILAGIQDKTPLNFLKALEAEGYYLNDSDLPVVSGFMHTKGIAIASNAAGSVSTNERVSKNQQQVGESL